MTQPETSAPIPLSDPETDPASVEDASEAQETPEPLTAENVSEWNAYYDKYVMLGVLLLVFIASANRISHSSIWTQLQAGKVMAANNAPLLRDAFSYTETDARWVNVPWLFEWGHALLYKAASDLAPVNPTDAAASRANAEQVGAGTLVTLNALVRVLTALLLLGIRRKGPGLWWSAVCVTLALGVIVNPAWIVMGGIAGPALVTPSTWGLFCLAIEFWVLHRAARLGTAKVLFALVPLFVLWANLDESFFIGLIFLAASTIGWIKPARGEEASPIGLTGALVVVAACAAACLANPSFLGVYRAGIDPFLSLFRPAEDAITLDQLSYFGKGIRQPSQAGEAWKLLFEYYVIVVAIGAASFWLNKRRFSLGRFLVYTLAAVLWGTMIRFGPEFAVVFAVTLTLNGQEWYQDRFGTSGRLGAGWTVWSVGGRAVTIVLLFACVAKAITGYGAAYGESRFGFGFDPDDFAFEAADFLKSASLKGNVLNTERNQGDALIWRAYPDGKTFVDSRQHLFPIAILNRHQEIRQALKTDDLEKWKPLLDQYNISTVMISPIDSRITYRTLSQSPNWIPFHDDGNVVLFGRADAVADDLAFFKKNTLDPDMVAYKVAKPTPSPDRPPTPVTWMDNVFAKRSLERPQPHTEAARRWLQGADYDPSVDVPPDPARCLIAIREARTALASKPDDPQAYRVLVTAYRALMVQETALLVGIKLTPENAPRINQISPRADLLPTRFRQRVTALNYAIQTTPPPNSELARRELPIPQPRALPALPLGGLRRPRPRPAPGRHREERALGLLARGPHAGHATTRPAQRAYEADREPDERPGARTAARAASARRVRDQSGGEGTGASVNLRKRSARRPTPRWSSRSYWTSIATPASPRRRSRCSARARPKTPRSAPNRGSRRCGRGVPSSCWVIPKARRLTGRFTRSPGSAPNASPVPCSRPRPRLKGNSRRWSRRSLNCLRRSPSRRAGNSRPGSAVSKEESPPSPPSISPRRSRSHHGSRRAP